ncbi:MAG: 50S ribosomal protein L30 [Candidatus Cloacimonetes bacterium]|nr:50S ribosomal protein L30 [Candidatus Cloacimonadota bacterium]
MKIIVTQIRSQIRHQEQHKRIVKALGLGRIGKSRVHEDNSAVRGMIEKVKFLVKEEPWEVEIKPENITVKQKVKKISKPPEVKDETIDIGAESKPKRKKKATADVEVVESSPETSESVSGE